MYLLQVKKMTFMLHSSFKYQDMSDPDQESTYGICEEMWKRLNTQTNLL